MRSCSFKVIRLLVLCNGLKRTISISGEFEMLQKVLELDTEVCVG